MLFLLCNIKFLIYLIFFDDIVVFDLSAPAVDLFVDVLASLVYTVIFGAIVIIDTPVAVVPSSLILTCLHSTTMR